MKLKTKLLLLNLLLVLAILYFEQTSFEKQNVVVEETGFIDVLFCPNNDCSKQLELLINKSNNTKCAFYDLENKFILASNKTKMLIDEDNFKGTGKKIEGAGLMHNKFCVFDDRIVWTGSFNPTTNTNLNNVIIIQSSALSQNYADEFTELENNQQQKTKYQKILFNNQTLQNYFCPEDNCKKHILYELEKSNISIHFLTFTFTDREIAELLVEKKANGVEVKGVMEKFQNSYSVKDYLKQSGIEVVFYEGEGFQHNKVFIIDNKTVITGSYNPTKAANTINDENILILEQKEVVEKYTNYFTNLVNTDHFLQ